MPKAPQHILSVNEALFKATVSAPAWNFFDRVITFEELEQDAVHYAEAFSKDMARSRSFADLNKPDLDNEAYLLKVENYLESLPCHNLLKKAFKTYCHQTALTNPILAVVAQILGVLDMVASGNTIKLELKADAAKPNQLIVSMIAETLMITNSKDINLKNPQEIPLFTYDVQYTVKFENNKLHFHCDQFEIDSPDPQDSNFEEQLQPFCNKLKSVENDGSLIISSSQKLLSQADFNFPEDFRELTAALAMNLALAQNYSSTELNILLANSKQIDYRKVLLITTQNASYVSTSFYAKEKNKLEFNRCLNLTEVRLTLRKKKGTSPVTNITLEENEKLDLIKCHFFADHPLTISIGDRQKMMPEVVLAFAVLNPDVCKIQYEQNEKARWQWLGKTPFTRAQLMVALHSLLSPAQRDTCFELINNNCDSQSYARFEKEYAEHTQSDFSETLASMASSDRNSVTLNLALPLSTALLPAFTNLTNLELDNQSQLTFANLGNLPELTALRMRNASQLLGATVSAPKLKSIDISGSRYFLMKHFLGLVAQSNCSLETMSFLLQNCEKLTRGFFELSLAYIVTPADLEKTPTLLSYLGVKTLDGFDGPQGLKLALPSPENLINREASTQAFNAACDFPKTDAYNAGIKETIEALHRASKDKFKKLVQFMFDRLLHDKTLLKDVGEVNKCICLHLLHSNTLSINYQTFSLDFIIELMSAYLEKFFEFQKKTMTSDDKFSQFMMDHFVQLFYLNDKNSHYINSFRLISEFNPDADKQQVLGRSRLTFLLMSTLLQQSAPSSHNGLIDMLAAFLTDAQKARICILYWFGDWDSNQSLVTPNQKGMEIVARLLSHLEDPSALFAEYKSLSKLLPYHQRNEVLYLGIDYFRAVKDAAYKRWHPAQQAQFDESLKGAQISSKFFNTGRRSEYEPIHPATDDHPTIGMVKK